jgi:catechol 2,3-dioxygenase-like lactoylglutathione lyase family enzyme
MLGYVTLGTNDLQKAASFYDAWLAEIGASRMMENDRFVLWSSSPKSPGLGVIKPYDRQPATVGNGVMAAIAVDEPAKVDALHRKGILLGAKDEGAPGPRGGGFYAGYLRDLDGNKLNVFCLV